MTRNLKHRVRAGSLAPLMAICLVCGTATAAWAGNCEWVLQGPATMPSERRGQGMVYDSNRDLYVMLGGRDTRPATTIWYTETWEYNGADWTAGPNIGITTNGLAQMAIAFDSGRNLTTLFGYSHSAGRSAETFEYDGMAWMQRAVSGAGFRNRAAMTYDSARARSVFFGGESVGNNPRNDTWEYDGNSWSQVSNTGPSPRFLHMMAYDAARGVVVLFGGRDRGGFVPGMNDTWTWDGQTWTQLTVAGGPSPRHSAAMTYDADREVVVLFGGRNDVDVFDDTWEWDGTTWTFITNTGPAPRGGHAMAWGSQTGEVILFGGYNFQGDVFNDTWAYVCNGVQPCYADCNGDGVLNVADFLCFIDEFAIAQTLPPAQQEMHYANCTGATAAPFLTVADFLCFIDEFAQGCP